MAGYNLDKLLDDKYPQQDMFICDVADAVLKDIIPQMEHPFYSLSKKPDISIRRYDNGPNWIEIIPSAKGQATIYDKDILIYAISQLMAKLNNDERISRDIRVNCHDLLKFCNRGTAGKDYKALCEAVDRIAGTRISTNIQDGTDEVYTNFGLIDKGSVRRRSGRDGRILWIEMTISEWVFDAIRNNSVLTLYRDYFRLRKPIERRTYEIARKHCGQSTKWTIGIEKLHKKSGSRANTREFRRSMRELTSNKNFPDYTVRFDEEQDQVTFHNRKKWWKNGEILPPNSFTNRDDTYRRALEILPMELDVETIFNEWLEFWVSKGTPDLRDGDAAFLGFCKNKAKTKTTLKQTSLL